MSASFTWSVETPEGVAAGGQCDFLVLPTPRGEEGVLASHAPLLVTVLPGELRVSREGAVERISVGRGVAEVRRDAVHLFVLTARRAASS
jgi:F-type H+-transporting ATPase subunit epsilon